MQTHLISAVPEKNTSSVFTKFLALILCVGTGWGAWKFLSVFFKAFGGSPPPVQAAVIAGCATVMVSVGSLILNATYQKQREIQAEHRKQKSEIYSEFLKFMFDMLFRDKMGMEPMTEVEMMTFFVTFSRRMIVWGSDEVLKEYLVFRTGTLSGRGPQHLMLTVERLLFAIRRDLGHDNKKLGERDLLRMFINDIDEVWDKPNLGETVPTL